MTKRQRPASLSQQLQNDLKKEKDKAVTKLSNKSLTKKTNVTNYKISEQNSLSIQFFQQEVVDLAKALLGKIFIRKTNQGIIKAIIVQTQAYKAPLDKGCHAYNNKKTERTKYFWLDGGHLYIYTIYMPTNVCLNVVAGHVDEPQAVLIRAVQPIEGIQLVKQFRKIKSSKLQDLCNGPGKVGQALGVNMSQMNGMSLIDDDRLKIIDGGIQDFTVGVSKRINIDYAQQWIDKNWRFYIEGNNFVSKIPNSNIKKKSKSKNK